MQTYLILRLSGPMQAWGLPTFEGARASAPLPTRSGLLGMLGACLGIKRNDRLALQALAEAVRFAVRCDEQRAYRPLNLSDFHTVKEAREKQGGLKKHDTIITRRDYLYDAHFTVAVWTLAEAKYRLHELEAAVQKPVYTPYLGRRSCPFSAPLFHSIQQAHDPRQALQEDEFVGGAIYSEVPLTGNEPRLSVRDEPLLHLPRQFGRREWYLLQGEKRCT